ncbi:MAG: VWA domain-containing protein [Caldisericota bacterium]|nr:VWA domain-containing protein [Caldisericota bacterium]
MSNKDIARAIEGVTALCLGSADRLVWVDQADAAAFTDGQRMYLPRPTGQHAEEYELLLALALREVAKLSSTDAEAMTGDCKVLPYSTVIEEVRLKAELSAEYRGAPKIFNNAVAIASRIFAASANEGEISPDNLKALAVWAASHRALLGTAEANASQNIFEDLARTVPGSDGLARAIQLAHGGPATRSSAEAAQLGQQIWTVLNEQEDPSPEDAGDDADSQSQDENGNQDEGNKGESSELSQPACGASGGSSGEDASSHGDPLESADEQGSADDGQTQDASDESTHESNASGDSGSPRDELQDDASVAKPKSSAAAESGGGADEAGNHLSNEPATRGDSQSAGGASGFSDPLSDALARLKGHARSKDYSAQAAEILDEASEGESVSDAALAAMREVMDSENPDIEQLVAAAALPADGGAQEERGEDLTACLCAGDSLAIAADGGNRSLLDAVPARLVTVLLRELQDLKRRPFIRAAAGAKVAVSQVWKLKRLGDVRVFKKRVAASGIDAAVSILLDRSESMEQNGFEAAVEVVHAFILALQRISGVRTSLDVFPGTHASSEQVLAFKQNLNAVSSRLRSIVPSGGTPTGTALATRLTLLLATRAEKKAIVVVTDGQPHPAELPLARAVIAQAVAEGVDVIGIGIGIEVGHLFPMSINVSNVGELPDALAELFQGNFAQRLAA